MKKTDQLTSVGKRLRGSTPPFWRKIRNIAGVITLIGGGLLVAPIALSATVITWLTVLVTISGTITGTAQATTNPED